MDFKPFVFAVVGAGVALGAYAGFNKLSPQGSAGAFSRDQIQTIVREYIVKNPEVLQEAMAEFERRQAAVEADKARSNVKNNAQLLFNSPRQVTIGNREGDVTLVEFFDYNCGYCKRALLDLAALLQEDGKLRVVLKEFPVLGPSSVEAAQVAVAVRMQDDGARYLDFHQRLLSGRGQVDKARALAAAKDAGFDMERMERDLASDEVRASLEESMRLAEQLGLNGTPSYVVGSEIVIGAVGAAALKEKVRLARCSATATC
jgi:protein-disulfide isomerase